MAAVGAAWGEVELGQQVTGTIARSAAALLMFNLLDGLFTLIYLQLELATEANPIMRVAYEGSPLGFMLAKLAMVNAGLWILASQARFAFARAAVHATAAVYAGIVAYHLSFLASFV